MYNKEIVYCIQNLIITIDQININGKGTTK